MCGPEPESIDVWISHACDNCYVLDSASARVSVWAKTKGAVGRRERWRILLDVWFVDGKGMGWLGIAMSMNEKRGARG